MRYFLDTEFNGFGGELLSLALVRDDGRALYLTDGSPDFALDPWVEENVMPVMFAYIASSDVEHSSNVRPEWSRFIEDFLAGDPQPHIVTDWPDDVRYFCQELITGPGKMISTARQINFTILRIDAYPTSVKDAVQHNALWDALALRQAVHELEIK